ncbi:hypothetical protein LK536_04680 [Lachnoclostridium pacaense]|uniref:DUF3592 domain-containing protein n=2 Tax=Enterocloster TaxID=2719313 RepID=A0ABV1DDM2_9FIRM|nr:hypothetical protein [Lachnoclostridium pacaense]EEQ61848.1 hypothetical protein CBFG_05560 [Clostridiales bacterium 1_7_47FAA]MCC2875563.1 hypothetical protein [Lachnoclostridium pacaense]
MMDRSIGLLIMLTAIYISIIIILFNAYSTIKEKNMDVIRRCIKKTIGQIDYLSTGVYVEYLKRTHNRYITAPSIPHRFTIYKFSIGNQECNGMDSRVPYAFLSVGKPGDEVDIYYNPNDITDFYCPREDKNIKIIPYLFILTALLCAVVLYFLYSIF